MSILLLTLFILVNTKFRSENQNILKGAIFKVDANVVFMRHALAPGFVDPDNFHH